MRLRAIASRRLLSPSVMNSFARESRLSSLRPRSATSFASWTPARPNHEACSAGLRDYPTLLSRGCCRTAGCRDAPWSIRAQSIEVQRVYERASLQVRRFFTFCNILGSRCGEPGEQAFSAKQSDFVDCHPPLPNRKNLLKFQKKFCTATNCAYLWRPDCVSGLRQYHDLTRKNYQRDNYLTNLNY